MRRRRVGFASDKSGFIAMPPLPNPRHESFVRLYIETGNAAASYLKAGYTPTTRSGLDAAASRLARKGKIRRRMLELGSQLAKRNAVTLDGLLDDLEVARALAQDLGQPMAAIKATMNKARLAGFLVERRETGRAGDFAGRKSEADLLALVRAELGEESADMLRIALDSTKA